MPPGGLVEQPRGIVASAAAVAGTGVFFASTAFANPSPMARCGNEGGDTNRHFRARAHVEPRVGNHTKITGYSYKIWGAIGDNNNVDFALRNPDTGYVSNTWVDRDEIAETGSGSDDWVWVDLRPNVRISPDNVYYVRAKAKFDVQGPDPKCDDDSPTF